MPSEDVAVIHKICGGVAFRVNYRPASTDIMDVNTVVWPENTIKPGDPIWCYACDQPIKSPMDIEIEGGFSDQQTEETQ